MLVGWQYFPYKGQPNHSLKLTLLSRFFVKLFSRLQRFGSSLVTLRKPQGGLARSRYAALEQVAQKKGV